MILTLLVIAHTWLSYSFKVRPFLPTPHSILLLHPPLTLFLMKNIVEIIFSAFKFYGPDIYKFRIHRETFFIDFICTSCDPSRGGQLKILFERLSHSHIYLPACTIMLKRDLDWVSDSLSSAGIHIEHSLPLESWNSLHRHACMHACVFRGITV